MIILYLASVLAALAAAPASPDGAGLQQATIPICRPAPDSSQFSAPQFRVGGSRLGGPSVCSCLGIYQKYDEPACNRDGSPAMFPAGRQLTAPEQAKLVSCKDVERRRR